MTFTCCGVVVVTRVQWVRVEWWGGGVDANRWFLGGGQPVSQVQYAHVYGNNHVVLRPNLHGTFAQ